MKIKNYFLLLIIILSNTSIFCQGENQFTLCHIDARFYKFNRNITVGLKERELKNYSTSYNLRFKKAFEAVLNENDYQNIKNISDNNYSDLSKLDSISDFLYTAYTNYIQTHKYSEKRAERIKPTPQYILDLLKHFGDKYDIDHLGIIKAEGFVKEKPDKTGEFDVNARGYIYFKGYDLDVETGRILFVFWEAHPRQSSVGMSNNPQQKLDVLTDRIIETMTRKYMFEFSKLWEKRKTPQWKT